MFETRFEEMRGVWGSLPNCSSVKAANEFETCNNPRTRLAFWVRRILSSAQFKQGNSTIELALPTRSMLWCQ